MNTKLIIIGTVHVGKSSSVKYAEFLTTALESIKPEIILAEFADYERDNGRLASLKPEYPEIIFPYAQANNIEIIGVMPDKSRHDQMEQAKAAVMTLIDSDQKLRLLWEYAGHWEDVVYGRLLAMLDNPVSMERLQMPEIDCLHISAWFESLSSYFPEYLKLWNEWNTLILNNIQSLVKSHAGKRQVLTIGLAHKYWLSEKLAAEPGLSAYDLISYKLASAGH